jgi:hypothetical protein
VHRAERDGQERARPAQGSFTCGFAVPGPASDAAEPLELSGSVTLLASLTVVLETRLGPCVFDKVEFLVCDLPIQALYFGTSFQRKLGLPD